MDTFISKAKVTEYEEQLESQWPDLDNWEQSRAIEDQNFPRCPHCGHLDVKFKFSGEPISRFDHLCPKCNKGYGGSWGLKIEVSTYIKY